ncbi:hypothetical protein Sta7437_3170 [Stanieria cyanosphaera PCC 7437]|uniref:EpsG family protein n=1 Tax=Stanieria cyanosphaera (strain ATCC 29371 / PCC 7437) TaxID=111780 RepID=K9XVX0_STAC7|nr:EpsG family protein [Stanieria cyanosphaera]AFZ36678.1 hypothetical protein Sta7437_3170 [Stanieria cyanosphaera PCC 7437]
MQLNLSRNYKQNILINKNDKAIFLFFGLALWVFIPILGIFPLIFFIHLNQKEKSKLNFVISLLVILTITIFVSSLDIISDLAVYVNNYSKLGTQNPFEISGSQQLEFVLWLISYPVYLISGGSNYAFVFFWSFVFNALTFWVIAKGFSRQNYGLLLLFIVSNPIFINFQGFLVRQYFATLLFLIAVINLDKKLVMWGIYLFSLVTHLANIIYLPLLLLYDKARLFKNKIFMILIIAAGIILPFSSTIVVDLADRIAGLLPAEYGAIILSKTSYYGREQTTEAGILVPLLENLLIFVLIFAFLRNTKFKTAQEKFLYFLYPVLIFVMYIGKDIHMFSNRVAFLLFPLSGIFYYFLIEHKWIIFKRFILTFLIIIKIMYFNYYLYNISIGNNVFHFLNDNVYNSSIFEYIENASHNFVNDVKIKELPNRSFI